MRTRWVRAAMTLWCALLGPSSRGLAQARQYEGRRIAAIRFEPDQQPLTPEQLAKFVPLKPGQALRLADIPRTIKSLWQTGRYEDVQVSGEPAGDAVAVIITTRPRWFVGPIEVHGEIKEPPNRGQIASATRLDLGQPLQQDDLGQAVEGVRQLFKNNGFFESQVRYEVDHEQPAEQVRLRFYVKPGDRARLRRPVIQGNPKMPEDNVVGALGWKRWYWFRWRSATQTNIQQGLERLREEFSEKHRLMPAIRVEELRYDSEAKGVTPVLNIDAGPKVSIRTVGADISRGRLKRYVPVFIERAVDRDLLVEGARNLTDYLQSQGYFQAEVDFEQRQVSDDEIEITYTINRGERQKLVHVGIDGNRYFNTETIRERMFLRESGRLRLRHGRFSEAFLQRDIEALEALYRSNGFRDARVRSEILEDYKGERGEIAVLLHIEEGPQWFVTGLEVEGVRRLDASRILPSLSSTEGQPFSEVNVAVDRNLILTEYHDAGFPDAAFDWRFEPAGEPNRVRLRYTITEGEQQFVRDVLVQGLETTRPRLVTSNVTIQPGEPLALTRMAATQRRLYELGLFAKVDMAIQNPGGETNSKYVQYLIEEGHKYSIAGGVGAELARIGGKQESFEAPAGQTGFSPRVSFDITRLNFRGLGHSIAWKSRLSTLQKRGLLTYTMPRFRSRENLDLSFNGMYDDSRDVRTFTSRRVEGSIQLAQRRSRATTAMYRFSYRRVSVDENTLKIAPFLIPQVAQPARIGMLSGNLIQDRRDDPADARRGIYNTLDLGLAWRGFGSEKSFVRFLGRNATYHPFGRQLVLARSLSIGWLPVLSGKQRESLSAIPFPERLFGGGGTSHRGFPDNQAGPRDVITGFPLGGRALLFHNTELRFPLIGENIGGVLFHDAGNIYSSLGNLSFRVSQRNLSDFDYMVHAVGFGIRYRTPVGPVRVDLAYSINSPRFAGFEGTREELLNFEGRRTIQRVSQFQFFFSIGQTF